MGCCYCCCCTILVLINIVYMIIGIVLTAVGLILVVAKDLVTGVISPMLESSLNSLKSNGGMNVDVKNLINGLIGYLSSIATILLIIGLIVFILSIIGMCSVCCKTKTLIIIYIALISIIIIPQIIAVIIFATSPLKAQEYIGDLLKTMIAKYIGFFDTTLESFLINVLNIMFNCCGANNYHDFNSSLNFNRNLSTTITYGGKNKTYSVYLYYPISCCQFKDFQFVDMDGCIQNQTYNNKDTGCASKMFNDFSKYFTLIYQAVGGIIGFQGLILLAAVVCLVSLQQDLEKDVKPV